MSSSKAFVVPVYARDALNDIKGLSLEAIGALFKFWMLHELHCEPLPPREERRPASEWDEWFRDKLDLKNVRTWRRVRDELLAAAKIRRAEDGRLFIARTMRAVERKRGGDPARWGGEAADGQGSLDLQGVHAAQRRRLSPPVVEKVVDEPGLQPGENRTSGEVRANIARTLPDVRAIRLSKPLIRHDFRPSLSYSKSESLHESVVVIPFAAPRARGDPASLRA